MKIERCLSAGIPSFLQHTKELWVCRPFGQYLQGDPQDRSIVARKLQGVTSQFQRGITVTAYTEIRQRMAVNEGPVSAQESGQGPGDPAARSPGRLTVLED